MNRNGGAIASNGSQHRRGRSVTAIPRDTSDDNKLLDLFSSSSSSSSRSRSLSVSVDESEVHCMKLGRLSVGSLALSKSGMDNLLLSSGGGGGGGGGKHDYDWLLTPPETPLFPSSDASDHHQPTVAARKASSTSRSASTAKASRLSAGQLDNSYSSRPARSSSVTRPSISCMSYNGYSSSSNRSSVLNTSSASVASIPRPSTPSVRSTATSYSRPSTPGSRSVSSRPSTPTKCRPTSSSFLGEKTRTLQNSRPSTPSSRPQIPANLSSSSARTNSRPSTPSHRNVASSPSTIMSRSVSGGQVLTNGRIPAAASRGSSPSPRTRPIPQPVVPPDFPLETPPNLRTTLPERPMSAGRSRPNSGVSVKGSSDAPGVTNPPRRQSLSPVVTRGRLPELSSKGRLHTNGHDFGATDKQRTPPTSESASRRLSKSLSSSAEGNGFGRTISKKSLDVALRHMDIRHGSANGNIRSLSGTAIFPQSIRSAMSKGQPARPFETLVAVNGNGAPPYLGGNMSMLEIGNHNVRSQDGNADEDVKRLSAKVSDLDIYESSRYDALLLREDAKNTNWLHSIDDESDEGGIFDNRFDILPEPFDPF